MPQVTRRRFILALSSSLAPFLPMPNGYENACADTDPLQWNLTPIYSGFDTWEQARLDLEGRIPGWARLEEVFGSGNDLFTALQTFSDAKQTSQKLITYAQLRADIDLRDALAQEKRQAAIELQARVEAATAWVDPALLTLGQKRIDMFFLAAPALEQFRFHISDALRRASHSLSPESEALLAAAETPLSGPGTIARSLTGSEVPRQNVILSGGATYQPGKQPVRSYAREDRKRIYDAFYGGYRSIEQSLAANLITSFEGDAFKAKVRHFDGSLSQALFGPNIPRAVYDTLISEANLGLPVLHRYYELRRSNISVEKVRMYDLVSQPVKLDRRFSISEIEAITLGALSPLGPDYVERLRKAIRSQWMDALPRPGKLTGSVTNSGAYDVHPYLLLNLTDDYASLTLFAHEWGHAMHNTLAKESQPFATFNAPTFLQEVGSTCHEQLLISHLIKTSQTREEKEYFLYQQMRVLETVFFHNALAAEFEAHVHIQVEQGAAPSGAALTKLYRDIMSRYYGSSVEVDEDYGIAWAQNIEYFNPFYTFQYCTSLVAAVHFSQELVRTGSTARERYLDVLRAGGSGYGYQILASAGLDLATREPYQALVALFSETMDAFEAIRD